MSPDHELVSAFVRESSENAFRSLVSRHVDLVFATAMRQVGDAGIAEEITQNVFITLARKAPRLGGVETLAGWLHRTTILESKARVRSELRRRRREDAAAQISEIEAHGTSPIESLLPMLDEALLHLRDGDRLALVLRFFEDRSLREVGVALGVEEDAARKRVARALDRVTEFFQRRGFSMAVAGGASALMTQAAQAAPVGLAISATKAGVGVGATGGFSQLLFQIMTLTKTQTVAACVLVAAMPLAVQWRAEARVARERDSLAAQITAARRSASDAEQELERLRASLVRVQTDTLNAELRRDNLNAQSAGRLPRPAYKWDDNSPFIRVPKELLASLNIPATANKRGKLSEQIKEALQLTGAESEQTQSAIDRFLASFHAQLATKVKAITPVKRDLVNGNTPADTRVFEFPDMTEQVKPLREQLLAELAGTLDPERLKVFLKCLYESLPVDGEYHGMSTRFVIVLSAHRVRFNPMSAGVPMLGWGMTLASGESVAGAMDIADIPDFLRPHLQDWITLAESQPAPK